MKKALSLLMVMVLFVMPLSVPAAAAEPTFTLMVYLCGTDLESDGGLATDDLNEMVKSGVKPGGNVNVYVQTGGTKNWTNKKITDGKAERWSLDSKGLTRLEKLGKVNMGDGDAFAAFLSYGLEHFPADRYGLIFWDHGAGATEGVCYDEITDDSLNMAEIYAAFQTVTQEPNYRKFAMVGFDACLMADYEMAVHLQSFTDYMIASEETEPGEGWSYDSWLPTLVKDPGADMETVGHKIVDGFLKAVDDAGYGEFGTLSVLNLNRMDALRAAVEAMGTSLETAVAGDGFKAISRTRQQMPSFGETDDAASDMIDLTLFAQKFASYDAAGAEALRKALADVVVVNGYTANLSASVISGLAVLVPFTTRADADGYLSEYDTQNLMPAYTGFVRGFVDTLQGGSHTFVSAATTQESVQDATIDWFSQYAEETTGSTNLWSGWSAADGTKEPEDVENGADSEYDDQSATFSLDNYVNGLFGENGEAFNVAAYDESQQWSADTYNSDTFASGEANAANTAGDATVEVSAGGETYDLQNPFADASGDYAYSVTLSDEDMQYLASADACLMMDVSDADNEYYVDFGYTQEVIVNWNSGKLYGLFDGTWPTLAGQMVCMYDQIANENYIRSLIPVTLNGEETYLLVVFDAEHPDGVVIGTTEGYNDAGLPVRGYEELVQGDIVVPQYELIYWDENDEEQSEPFTGDPITVGAGGTIAFGYDDVESEADYVYGFCLNDVFGGYQYTDFITLSF
ncbi:MAG: clostripain-related cysteine peptidase [Eubacteriales bacterium]|nr:clostripain-related cysteine peptidase [Eubacteriales bacterium]